MFWLETYSSLWNEQRKIGFDVVHGDFISLRTRVHWYPAPRYLLYVIHKLQKQLPVAADNRESEAKENRDLSGEESAIMRIRQTGAIKEWHIIKRDDTVCVTIEAIFLGKFCSFSVLRSLSGAKWMNWKIPWILIWNIDVSGDGCGGLWNMR